MSKTVDLASSFPAEQPQPAAATESYQVPSEQTYTPSRQELRQWCAVAIANDDKPLVDKIVAKGQQLNERYQAETGETGKPPTNYRHSAIVISEGDRKEMHQAIAAAREMLQATASPQRHPHHAQTEISFG